VAATDAVTHSVGAGAPTPCAYQSDDLAGVEVGGGAANVLAIAAGASDGLVRSQRARCTDHCGLAETGRLSTALAWRRETLMV
jgi:glycerol-3-phosphate dehydrogenase (NAD(P)+)